MEKKVFGIIYRTTNLINGRMYIGKHQVYDNYTREFDGYLGSGTLLKRAVSYYGKENFKRETLKECYSDEELCNEEIKILKEYDCANNPVYYNCINRNKLGGRNSGYHHSEETKEKIRQASIKRGISEETRNKMKETKNLPENFRKRREKISKELSGRKCIYKDDIQKTVPLIELNYYLSNGWKLGVLPKIVESRISPQRGKKRVPQSQETILKRSESLKDRNWIHKEEKTAFINKEDLNSYISEGWELGKNNSFKEMRSSYMKNIVQIYKGDLCKRVPNSEVQNYLNDGWSIGQPQYIRDKLRKSHEGKIWVQNGIKAVKISKEDLQEYLDKGYVRGQKIKPIN